MSGDSSTRPRLSVRLLDGFKVDRNHQLISDPSRTVALQVPVVAFFFTLCMPVLRGSKTERRFGVTISPEVSMSGLRTTR